MELREMLIIEIYPFTTDLPIENEHILIAEIVGDRHHRFYFCELPVIDNKIRRKLRFYENIVN